MQYLLSRHLVRTREDSEDVTQDAFLAAWKHRDTFRGDAKFSTWFTTILIREALMKRRTNEWKLRERSVSAKKLPSGEEVDYLETIAVPAAEYDPLLMRKVTAAVHELSPRKQQVILCVYSYEWTLQKTSEHMHMHLGTVKVYLHRAKKQLRKLLDAA